MYYSPMLAPSFPVCPECGCEFGHHGNGVLGEDGTSYCSNKCLLEAVGVECNACGEKAKPWWMHMGGICDRCATECAGCGAGTRFQTYSIGLEFGVPFPMCRKCAEGWEPEQDATQQQHEEAA